MTDIFDPTRGSYVGQPAGRATMMQGGAVVDVPHDSLAPALVTVTDQGVVIVPTSVVGRFVSLYNEGYCAVRLGARTSAFAFDSGGYLLVPDDTLSLMMRGEMQAIAPPGSTGLLSVAVGTP